MTLLALTELGVSYPWGGRNYEHRVRHIHLTTIGHIDSCGQSCVLWAIIVQFCLPICSSKNPPSATTGSLDRLCHREPGAIREGASGPGPGFANVRMNSQGLHLTLGSYPGKMVKSAECCSVAMD